MSSRHRNLELDGRDYIEQTIHNTTSIRYVMENGRLHQAADLTEIWPECRPRAAMHLWDRDSIPDSTRSTTHVN
jgi:hypothetical protein